MSNYLALSEYNDIVLPPLTFMVDPSSHVVLCENLIIFIVGEPFDSLIKGCFFTFYLHILCIYVLMNFGEKSLACLPYPIWTLIRSQNTPFNTYTFIQLKLIVPIYYIQYVGNSKP